MTSADESSSTKGSALTGKKRLANTFGSLFSSKPTQISDYEIELDEPHRTYSPGDHVEGRVILKVVKPLGVTHVVISLYGYVQVFKRHSALKDPVRNSTRDTGRKGRRWTSEYYGDGFVSLFEDESVLCGEGRMDPYTYIFKFSIPFPTHPRLPSSIDFERGTICYALSSTLTRPLALNPTRGCEKKIMFRDVIDVGTLQDRGPLVASLEPIEKGIISNMASRRSTTVSSKRSATSSNSKIAQSTRTLDDSVSLGESQISPPLSPGVMSAGSGSDATARHGQVPPGRDSSSSIKTDSDAALLPTLRTITATVNILKAGCLPGESVPLVVRIDHAKPVKSVTGIIATLYRQARTDLHPDLPLRPSQNKGGKERYEDYYPRSKSGLGGLSLSAAGSSQTWRKNLSQTVAPLYIDPISLSSEVKLAVRVPADAFATIKNTPGNMISFTYHIEVVIDIHGKLATHDHAMNALSGRETYTNGAESDGAEHRTAWGASCVDTSSMRRTRGALTMGPTELIIGHKNTRNWKGKQRQVHEQASAGLQEEQFSQYWHDQSHPEAHEQQDGAYRPGISNYSAQGHAYNEHYGYGYDYEQYNSYDEDYEQHYYPNDWEDPRPPYQPVPFPPNADNENLTEKQRLQRAEASLLPSQPPGAQDTDNSQLAPSAPFIPNESDFDSADAFRGAVERQDYAVPSHQPVERAYTDGSNIVIPSSLQTNMSTTSAETDSAGTTPTASSRTATDVLSTSIPDTLPRYER
ncbi:MAG: ph-response sensor protein [Chrysothrix sp. TS-e1954]|nr:MAG: ph-response sensor protein [Chrysothrix sp. TS-e1954]